jgi:hypothetical protein
MPAGYKKSAFYFWNELCGKMKSVEIERLKGTKRL